MQMKMQGKKPSDVLLLRSYLEDALEGHGIALEPTGVNPRRYRPTDPALVDLLMYQKRDETPRRALVDLAAINEVATRRHGSPADLESSGFVILSCDATLARFNVQQMGHDLAGTYPEVVLDKTLTTLLWLKNPGLDVPLEAVVAAHSRGLLHRQAVWFQVVVELSRAATEGTTSARDISVFLSSDGPNVIAETVNRVEEVTPEVVQAMIRKARAAHEEEISTIKAVATAEGERAVVAVQETAEESIRLVRAEAEKAKDDSTVDRKRIEELEQKQESAKNELIEEARTRARVWAFVVPSVTAIVVAVLVLWMRPQLETLWDPMCSGSSSSR